MRGLERVPFGVSLAIAAGVLVLGIFLSFRYSAEWVLFATLVVVVVFAALVLLDYNQRPLEKPAPRPAPSAMEAGMQEPVLSVEEDTDFSDPVIEADRIASGEVLPDVVEGEAPPPAAQPPESPAAPKPPA